MTEELLDGSNVVTVFEQVGGKGVAKSVRGNGLVYSGKLGSNANGFLVLPDPVGETAGGCDGFWMSGMLSPCGLAIDF